MTRNGLFKAALAVGGVALSGALVAQVPEFTLAIFVSASIILTSLFLLPNTYLHPTNFFVAHYFLYVSLPVFTQSGLQVFGVESVLPWGRITDFSTVSALSFLHFFITFFFCACLARLLISKRIVNQMQDALNARSRIPAPSPTFLLALLGLGFALLYLFIDVTGGVRLWVDSYSEMHTKGRSGVGPLAFFLIQYTHFIAFSLGLYMFTRRESSRSLSLLLLGIAFLLLCAYFQGLKSRLPLLLFFYFLPILLLSKPVMHRLIPLVIFMLALFAFGMYFRSEGVYSSLLSNLEYFTNYFDMLILHDQAMLMDGNGIDPVGMSINKWLDLLGIQDTDRTLHDLAINLTASLHPYFWYTLGATKQFPIETWLFFISQNVMIWCFLLSIYVMWFSFLARISVTVGWVGVFVYASELMRIMSVMRSGLITWDIPLRIGVYVLFFAIWVIFSRVRAK